MLERLPVELLDLILPPLDDRDLCSLAMLCHTLHIMALDMLFTRNKTLIQSSDYSPSRHFLPSSGSEIRIPTSGACIELATTRNLGVLMGLRIARPMIFAHQPIKAIKCLLSKSPSLAMEELRNLTEFLCSSPNISHVEVIDINIDTAAMLSGGCFGDSIDPTFVELSIGLLRRSVGREGKLSHCVSFNLSGNIFVGVHHPHKKSIVPWIRRGSTAASILQTVGILASPRISSLLHGDSSTSASTPRMLDVDSCFILQYIFMHKSPGMIQYCHSIRVLTLSGWIISFSWLTIAAYVTLPNLEELSFCYPEIPSGLMHGFLIRHRKISIIHATGVAYNYTRDAPRRMPPFFLPKLTTLTSPANLLPYILGTNISPTSLPSLKSIRITVSLENVSSDYKFIQAEARSIAERLSDPHLTLQFAFLIKTKTTSWLYDQPAPSSPGSLICKSAKYVEVRHQLDYEYLDFEEVRSGLPTWLQLFPIVEKVDLYGCSKADEEKMWQRRLLFEEIRKQNPNIKTICVDSLVMWFTCRFIYFLEIEASPDQFQVCT